MNTKVFNFFNIFALASTTVLGSFIISNLQPIKQAEAQPRTFQSINTESNPSLTNTLPYQIAMGAQFRLQTGTALHETGSNFDFAVLPNGDLVAIKKSNTGTNSTEVHIISR